MLVRPFNRPIGLHLTVLCRERPAPCRGRAIRLEVSGYACFHSIFILTYMYTFRLFVARPQTRLDSI